MSDFEEAVNLLRAAPDSGVRVSRLRVLRVECVPETGGSPRCIACKPPHPRGARHHVGEPERAPGRVGRPGADRAGHLADQREQTRSASLPMFLNVDSGDDLYEVHVASSCCTRTVTLGWIRECLASSARRVVLPSNGTVE